MMISYIAFTPSAWFRDPLKYYIMYCLILKMLFYLYAIHNIENRLCKEHLLFQTCKSLLKSYKKFSVVNEE